VTPVSRRRADGGEHDERVDYESRAEAYGRTRGLAGEAIAPWRDALAPYLEPARDRPLVDVGSGGGHFSIALAEWFEAAVVGVEPSSAMRAVARRDNAHPRVAYVAGRAEALPLADATCGAAWLSTVVHHVDLRACARELDRVLRPRAPILVRSAFPGRLGGITLFRFFPAARRRAERFPTIEAIADAFSAFGRGVARVTDVAQVSAPSLRAFCDRVRAGRHADTTLVSLTDEEFEAGVASAERAAAAEATPAPVVDRLTLLVLV